MKFLLWHWNPLDLMLLITNILFLPMSINDGNGHDKEANVSQEDQHHWDKERPDE